MKFNLSVFLTLLSCLGLLCSCLSAAPDTNDIRVRPAQPVTSVIVSPMPNSIDGKIADTLELTPTGSPEPRTEDEISYIYNGGIQIIDLNTREIRKLTSGSTDRWPTWSTDGQYMIYERLTNEVPDLYIWDSRTNEHRILVEAACCAAWNPSGSLIAFISYAGVFPLEVIQPNGSGRRVLMSSTDDIYHISTSSYNHPNGRLVWPEDDILFLPLETDEPSTSIIFMYYLAEPSIDLVRGPGFPSEPDCSLSFFRCLESDVSCLEAPALPLGSDVLVITQDWSCAGFTPEVPKLGMVHFRQILLYKFQVNLLSAHRSE